jgi:hypothetical protein
MLKMIKNFLRVKPNLSEAMPNRGSKNASNILDANRIIPIEESDIPK